MVALACAGAPGGTALGQHYSANAVGYIDANFYAGSNLVANPLNAGDNRVSNLFRGVPDGSFFLPWDSRVRAFFPTNRFVAAGGWTDADAILMAPNGGFLWLPAPTKITFVGEPWPTMCVTYPGEISVSSVMPEVSCAFCDNISGECPAEIPELTTMSRWNAAAQEAELYEYSTFYGPGWARLGVPVTPQLAPTEAAVFFPLSTFTARLVSAGSVPANVPWVTLHRVRRSGTDFVFQFGAANDTAYALLGCSDLASNQWQVVRQDTASATGGVATVAVEVGTNTAGFYRLHPPYSPSSTCLENPVRRGSQFRFQFYAQAGTNYVVQRAASQTSETWQDVTTVLGAANLATVTDTNASAASGYYRLQF